MKKYLANVITLSRVALSLPLLIIPMSSAWFYVLYLFCGLSDMIDGAAARKMGTVSDFGARLDTVADFVFTFVCAVLILPILHIPVWLWVWIAVVALIKIFNIAVVFAYEKKLISIHSAANKIAGFALFLLPLTLSFVETVYSVAAACVLATVAAMQEAYFVAKGKTQA
ncbi:MAG: CDP-alcohol phosphatidyltransferase family protein [Clostridia bacterium]|nr:CDP-alcohol phosphatidyltransferase family protein [Clostridia bacterium]